MKSDLERKLQSLKEELGKTRDISRENSGLRLEIGRLQNRNQEYLSQIRYLQEIQDKSVQLSSFMITMYETFLSKLSEKERKVIASLTAEKKELLQLVKRVEEERDVLKDEIRRINALPNPVGVGLELKEDIFHLADGRQERRVTVESMILGMSASNSNMIQKGDELLQVNGQIVDDLPFPAIRESVCGQRGSLVSFRFRRFQESADSSSPSKDFQVVLKRGSWGAEYAVVSPEASMCLILVVCSYSPQDQDLLDVRSWPQKDSLNLQK